MTDGKTIVAAHAAAHAALERARAVLAGLERDHAAALARQKELSKTRERLALAGLAGGSARDQRDLQAATEESARIGLTVENLVFAIKAAREDVAAAEAAVERAAFRAKASAAQGEQVALRHAAADTVAGLDAFLAGFDRLVSTSNAIRRSGVGRFPSEEVFLGACRRSLQAAMMQRRLNSEPVIVAAALRKPLGEVIERFLDELELSIERQLEEPSELEAAE
jgi:hypothetical protein